MCAGLVARAFPPRKDAPGNSPKNARIQGRQAGPRAPGDAGLPRVAPIPPLTLPSPMLTSPLLPLHERAGARLVPAGAGQTVLTYGDVPAEYRAAQEACALFDATDRGALRVTGGEREEFLHRLTANRVRGLEKGASNPNLLLTSKGKVAHAFDVEISQEHIDLSVPPGAPESSGSSAGRLLEALDRYLFTEDVELEDTTEQTAPLELCGPRAGTLLAALAPGCVGLEEGHWGEFGGAGPLSGHTLRVSSAAVAGSPGWRIDGGPEAAGPIWEALVAAGATPAGIVVRDILRVEACAPAWDLDIDDNIYPQEARLESAFSLEKGCYIGQEVVAKIDTYGGLNKRLVALRVAHDDPVPRGTSLIGDDDRELGLVTSWAYSFVLDTGLCLGYVKRRHQAVGTTFRLGGDGAEATIVEVPVRTGAVPVTGEFEEAAVE